ncbi:hypothetical protein BEL04_15675 [Mucilaginibacter sp. PPCGB 2223]|uniref:hypothetical protein n=1 Tax=Mucilaginibacter sp. PPCGB 2223 TaxID=1886027 RepID=UPI000825A563|nr:hypothetical protein [Mucilaginibacter sp. PPCGB 2223]OCX51465.1 hypothetical protein BEL04_15675 [Mucilaginibacter sp. PPCGB 2223]
MSILITAATSAQAYKLKAALNTGETILLGDYLELPQLMVQNGTMVKTPGPENPSFAHLMLTLALDNGISRIYALRHTERALLQEAETLFAEFDIELCTPGKEFIAD